MAKYTKWRIFKIRSGRLTGLWCARNQSRADGFAYEWETFESQPDALSYVQQKST